MKLANVKEDYIKYFNDYPKALSTLSQQMADKSGLVKKYVNVCFIGNVSH